MKTFGLGRYVETFGLGVPYGQRVPAQGKSKAHPDRVFPSFDQKAFRRREEEEILLFLKTILTKGLI